MKRPVTTLTNATIVGLMVALVAGCASGRGPRQIRVSDPAAASVAADWSRVTQLRSGSEIRLQTRSSTTAAARYVVLVSEADITVVNLTEASLPEHGRRVLRDMLTQHPEYFSAPPNDTFASGAVRIGHDGVFVDDRKVAEYGQVVETLARRDVTEIRGRVVARGSVPGALLGGWIGFAIGVLPGLGGASTDVAWLVLSGSVAGGGYLGNRWSSHETDGIVYRAP